MIILSHTTALHCLRHFGAEAISALPRIAWEDLPERLDGVISSHRRYLAFCESAGMPPVHLHVLRSRVTTHVKVSHLTVHSITDIASHSFIRLSEGVFCVSPELLARQLALRGSVCQVAYLLYELFGIYAHPRNKGIDIVRRETFTSKARLTAYVKKHRPFPGVETLDAAVLLTRERSASHMETACAMLLGLPYRLGGLNFPDFEMNREVAVPQRLRKEVGKQRVVIDLCWPESMVALEYDSKEWHHGADQVARDSARRNSLLRMGFKVVTLTGVQASDRGEIMRTSRILADALGHRLRLRSKAFPAMRRELEHLVLKDKGMALESSVND